jgi:uncharacterized protein (TIGR03435 family)
MNLIRILIGVVALVGNVYGQAFEVASIREADPALVGIRGSIEANPGSLVIRNTTLLDAIRWAYDEDGARVGVVGGPAWKDSARYNIVAKPPAAASNNQLRIMLRALLADRFKLVVHAERKEQPAYFLTVDPKGHKLRPAKTSSLSVQPDATGVAFQNATMNDLQLFLLRQPGIDRPVINRTGLEGAFDFKLAMLSAANTEEPRNAPIAAGIPAFADAIAPLGLKLDAGRVPIDVITIETVERPSEN